MEGQNGVKRTLRFIAPVRYRIELLLATYDVQKLQGQAGSLPRVCGNGVYPGSRSHSQSETPRILTGLAVSHNRIVRMTTDGEGDGELVARAMSARPTDTHTTHTLIASPIATR